MANQLRLREAMVLDEAFDCPYSPEDNAYSNCFGFLLYALNVRNHDGFVSPQEIDQWPTRYFRLVGSEKYYKLWQLR